MPFKIISDYYHNLPKLDEADWLFHDLQCRLIIDYPSLQTQLEAFDHADIAGNVTHHIRKMTVFQERLRRLPADPIKIGQLFNQSNRYHHGELVTMGLWRQMPLEDIISLAQKMKIENLADLMKRVKVEFDEQCKKWVRVMPYTSPRPSKNDRVNKVLKILETQNGFRQVVMLPNKKHFGMTPDLTGLNVLAHEKVHDDHGRIEFWWHHHHHHLSIDSPAGKFAHQTRAPFINWFCVTDDPNGEHDISAIKKIGMPAVLTSPQGVMVADPRDRLNISPSYIRALHFRFLYQVLREQWQDYHVPEEYFSLASRLLAKIIMGEMTVERAIKTFEPIEEYEDDRMKRIHVKQLKRIFQDPHFIEAYQGIDHAAPHHALLQGILPVFVSWPKMEALHARMGIFSLPVEQAINVIKRSSHYFISYLKGKYGEPMDLRADTEYMARFRAGLKQLFTQPTSYKEVMSMADKLEDLAAEIGFIKIVDQQPELLAELGL